MIKKSVLAVALLSAICTQAEAITINADGAWHAFDVDNSVSTSGELEWIDLDNNALSFDFSLTKTAILQVVDGGYAGDQFLVIRNGIPFNNQTPYGSSPSSIWVTNMSTPTNSYPDNLGTNFDVAFNDANFSRGIFKLAPGNYSITGVLIQSALDDEGIPLNATVGAIRLQTLTAVPLPSAAGLYATGAGLLGWVSRRRKSTK
ncbi:hypothetical membrane protein [Methylomonas albis]|uniref:VPLPA-CTERM sorting domain-containing protein n=1 Tax=Methylomonas albis TaxID=1854563 RepID=A0ABR9D2V7_9GAMM|nr:VPLPA-CTERM sorting domain-containing protein [Methylomonas albis]MBD9357452.1 VPLPA-CTERM sorting domain-containing protein [Methylomonas albis]CAD6880718.1 hypothetical membrane protein [Methylomonas albis]